MSRAEAQARRLLWLFPLWMRSTRGEEAVSLVLDLLSPDAPRLPLRSRLDLVRAGLQARRRGTPPLRVWSALAFAGRKPGRAAIPVGWRPWLVSVVNRKRFVVQCAAMRSSYLLVMALLWTIAMRFGQDADWWMPTAYTGLYLVGVAAFVLRRGGWRAAVLVANGLADDGRPLPPEQVQLAWSDALISNVPLAPGLLALAVTAGAYGPAQWFKEQDGRAFAAPVGALALAAVLVVLALLVVRRRLRSFDPASPASVAPPRRGWRHDRAGALLAGLGVGYVAGWCAAQLAIDGHLHPLAVLAVPLAALVGLREVRHVEQRVGRGIGLWDLLPGTSPQVIVRPSEASTPWTHPGPGRPAAG